MNPSARSLTLGVTLGVALPLTFAWGNIDPAKADPIRTLGGLGQLASSSNPEEDLQKFAKLAKNAEDEGNYDLAEQFYERALNIQLPVEKKRGLLLQMAEGYRARRSITKAITVYERFCSLFPNDPEKSGVLLKIGRLYRDVGAYKLALDRFYNVLQSVLKIKDGDPATYRADALTAQFEIAETYFIAGDYPQATKFYKLIKLLDLGPEDQEKVAFKSLYCEYLQDHRDTTITQGKDFIKQFPGSNHLPEVRFILAKTLKTENRTQEAFNQVMELLREGKSHAARNPELWAYWQKRAGNQIANEFYMQGDFLNALAIYQALAKLSDAPDWQWPVVFQMGLCFERLRYTPRAIEAFQYIVKEFNKHTEGKPVAEHLETLKQAAEWHIEQLTWKQDTEKQLRALLSPTDIPEVIQTALPKKPSE